MSSVLVQTGDEGVTLTGQAASRLLERGEAPLAESLSLFEEGTKLASACQGALQSAEQLVVKLQKGPGGEPIEHPFGGEA